MGVQRIGGQKERLQFAKGARDGEEVVRTGAVRGDGEDFVLRQTGFQGVGLRRRDVARVQAIDPGAEERRKRPES